MSPQPLPPPFGPCDSLGLKSKPDLGKVLGGAWARAKELEEALWQRWGGERDEGFQYSQSIKALVSNLPRSAML